MRIPIFQVDAFTDRPFAGNPAAVCPIEHWLPDPLLQAIAAENNLSETAFLVAVRDGYHLRWFTPTVEVELCGHATLAAAKIIFERLQRELHQVRFQTRSGELSVARDGEQLVLDFPAQPGVACNPHPDLVDALGAAPVEILRSVLYYLAVFDSAAEVKALRPDERGLLEIDRIGVIATAPATEPDVDFVSRFFAPRAGVYEDPVTGSAHCVLTPYWAQRLDRTMLRARQISRRGGSLACELRGDRVGIGGRAVLVMEGQLILPTRRRDDALD
jgi:PhzF family phenazine biosynthesis protein